MPIPKPVRLLDADYLSWVKTQPCYAATYVSDTLRSSADSTSIWCCGPIDAHHIVTKGGGKTGSKADDRRCVPACRMHHEWAECYPAEFRRDYEPEALIAKLNTKYDATHKPRPKPPRSITPSVKTVLVRCDCGQTHRIGASKSEVADLGNGIVGLKYYCGGKTKGWKAAIWS